MINIPPTELERRFFDPAMIKEIRVRLADGLKWYRHITGRDRLDSIATEGLQRRNPVWDGFKPDDEVCAAFGDDAGNIVCLYPFGTFEARPAPSDSGDAILAIHADDLPERIGLDWSYSGVYGKADGVRQLAPHLSDAEVFVEVVKKRGSVACFDPIPADAIRIWIEGQPTDNPQGWPFLRDVISSAGKP